MHYLIFQHQFSIFPFCSTPGNVGHFVVHLPFAGGDLCSSATEHGFTYVLGRDSCPMPEENEHALGQ